MVTLALLAIPGLPLAAAALLLALTRAARTATLVACTATAASLGLAVAAAPAILAGETLAAALPWAPSVGLALSLRLDGLAFVFVLLILGIGLLVVTYAAGYLAGDPALPRFLAALLLFMSAMLGIVTAGNLLLLVVAWELTSISSFLLIGFRDADPAARAGAYQSLIVTGAGGLALLAGVLVLGGATGTFELATLTARAPEVRATPGATAALALILLGAFTKSAQVPFHFWLPSAMAAPTPVSAYLHSATMVKAGVFLLARLAPIFAATDLWRVAVTAVGAGTLLVGGWSALRQTDLKRLLAYSTVSQLGIMTMLLGLGTATAATAAILYVVSHAVFKAPLFMIAGIVDHEAGTRDLRRLGGLARRLPVTAGLAAIAAASMAGLPPLAGFVAKELFYEATLAGDDGTRALVLLLVAVGGSTLTVAYSLRFVVGTFFGPPGPSVAGHEPPRALRLPVEILVLLTVALGVAPHLLAEPLVAAAARAVFGGPVDAHLALWHGAGPALVASIAATVAGTAWFVTHPPAMVPALRRSAGDRYDTLVAALLGGARRLTDAIQNGSLRRYLTVVIGGTVTLAVVAAARHAGAPAVLAPPTPMLPGAALVTVLTIVAAVAVGVLHRHRLPSVLALGAVGLFVAVYFVWLSAPDLVLTQILVETVTVILVVLVLHFLPHEVPARERAARLAGDAALATATGSAAALAVWAVIRRPFASISRYHLAESLPAAGGGNVVNVILVDFRGYDTLGEITVLGVAALGVLALVATRRSAS